MTKNNDKKCEQKSKMAEFFLGIFSGFIKKLSLNLVFNAKKQVDQIVFQIKSGIMILIFLILGFTFLLVGLAYYFNATLNFFPGDGYFLIGIASIGIGFLITLFRKHH